MSRPWMPLYIGDFLADTMHLNCQQTGAYLRLLMHAWQHDGLVPDDDRILTRIVRCHPPHWPRLRRVLEPFFSLTKTPGSWSSYRLSLELTKATEISNKRKAAAKNLHSKRSANAQQMHTQSQLQSHYSEAKASAASGGQPVDEDPKAKLFRIGKTVLVSFGVAEKRTGALIGQWLKTKNDPVGVLAAIQYARFQNVAEPVAYISALLKENPNGHAAKRTLSDLATELADEARERERALGLSRSANVI